MQLKKTVAAVALGFGLIASAQAVFIKDLGTLTFGESLWFDYKPNQGLGDWFAGVSFSNEFSFKVADDAQASVTLDLLGIVPLIGWLDFPGRASIEDLAFSVYKGADLVFTLDKDSTAKSFLLDSATDYTLVITGTLYGKGEGLYSFGMTAQAVPEPAEYAMLLAGLGLVGMVARRRKMTVN